jgi:hypothetical protein
MAALERGSQWAAWGFLAPLTVYLLAFYAYPLYRNLDLSLRNYAVYSFVHGGAPFAGLANYTAAFHDPTFAPALAVFFAQHFPLSALLRALFLVPWLLPLIVSASTRAWMLDSGSGVVNYALHSVGIGPADWLTSPQWSLPSVIIVNVWIGVPFNLVLLYSGLQAVPQEPGRGARRRHRVAAVPQSHPVVPARIRQPAARVRPRRRRRQPAGHHGLDRRARVHQGAAEADVMSKTASKRIKTAGLAVGAEGFVRANFAEHGAAGHACPPPGQYR